MKRCEALLICKCITSCSMFIYECGCDVIGSHASLRSSCRKTCQFESDQPHQVFVAVVVTGQDRFVLAD